MAERTVNDITLELAVLKALADHIKTLVDGRKKELRQALPRGTAYATIKEAGEVATVVVTADTSTRVWRVTNPGAFLRWVKEHQPTAIVESVRSTDEQHLLANIETTGVLPDGVELVPVETKGSERVNQTAAQRQNLFEAWRGGHLESPARLLEIEGSD